MSQSQHADLLTRIPLLKKLLKSRAFQPVFMLISLTVFVLAILTGWLGTPAGSRNFGIIFVWIVWWALLIIIMVPFLGRAWCTICPIPAPGEWLQRRGIINRVPGKLRTLGLRWPRGLKNIWLQNFGFLGVAIFSAIILTRPTVSAWVLMLFLMTGVVLSVLFEKRTFCRYVCPVGGFIGLYSMVSPVELRVADPNLCATHTPKDCIVGNENGYGCPWMVYPGSLERNTYCGMCTECLKTCPHDNIVINIREFGKDLMVASERRLDEAYKAFIMLGCALIYSAVLLGPWGWVKSWANMDSFVNWVLYAIIFLATVLLVLPALFWLTTTVSRAVAGLTLPVKRLFVDYAYALVPMGLAAWIAFSFSFIFTNGSYALPVLSDPFGWGWNIIGTANWAWTPLWPALVSFLQVGALMIGLLFSINTAYKISQQYIAEQMAALRATLPVAAFISLVVLGFLRLYLG